MSGLVCLLPHGYEGQGPEHSSARLERFLQLYAEDNIQVLYPSTPASYFHGLRRQLHRDFRKPLIVMTPKSLLRLRQCTSTIEEMGPGSSFHRVMYEKPPSPADREVRRVILCAGKVYYELVAVRDAARAKNVAIVRLEQLFPLEPKALLGALSRYREGIDVVWVQEEPRNMGAWDYIEPSVGGLLAGRYSLSVIARAPSASPAAGSATRHKLEQESLLNQAIGVSPRVAVA
jgi:2-oxoglutarate dehydrogenase E1 component